MLIKPSDYRRPTDGDYAFTLKPAAPRLPEPGARTDVREVIRSVLGDEGAQRFEAKISRWTGPEDEVDGATPYAVPQLHFVEAREEDLSAEALLRGDVLVLRARGRTDYVLRDHHTLDVLLYEYAATGTLPTRLFHADRHSDWADDRFLSARRPDQAATWWSLLEGLKRPDGKPVLRERDVLFTTALAERTRKTSGRDIGFSTRIPGSVDPAALGVEDVLSRDELSSCDFVSLDLDYFLPRAQLKLTSPLLRDARFANLMAAAKVRLFVLSPQFLNGGDKLERWTTHGSVSSALRLLRLLRR